MSKDPYPGKTPAERNKAWDHTQALDNIRAIIVPGSTHTPAQIRELLGDGLFGQYLALRGLGFPGEHPDVDYTLADPFGGVWGVQSSGSGGKFTLDVWTGGPSPSATKTTPMPADAAEFGWANGLNGNLDGPA